MEEVALWDFTMTVTGLDPGHLKLPWSDVHVTLTDDRGEVVFVPRRDTGTNGTTRTVLYSDGHTDESVGPGDSIELAGLNSSRPAMKVGIWLDDQVLYEGDCPDPFAERTMMDYRDVVAMLGAPTLSYAPVNGTPLWRMTFPVKSIEPYGTVIPPTVLRVIAMGPQHVPHQNMTVATFGSSVSSGSWDAFTTGTVAVWFIDSYGEIGSLDVGDAIGITGFPKEYAGGHVSLWVQSHYTSTVKLPDVLQ